MKTITTTALLILSLGAEFALAHGEDKPGPNGGVIRMPGAFHTEIIQKGANSVKIFLLDIDWKNPTVKASNIKITHKESGQLGNCEIESNYFVCQFPKNIDLTKKGALVVLAQRDNLRGNSVSYDLPLSMQKTESDHSSHH